MIIADPVDDSLTGAIKVKNVLRGEWNVYHYYDNMFDSTMQYVLHEDYVTTYDEHGTRNKWKSFDQTVTVWGRMFGFFDKNFYRTDDLVGKKKISKNFKIKNPGDKWYNWKGQYEQAVLDGGCTFCINAEDFCPADDFGCFYLQNDKGKIYGLALVYIND